MSDLKAQDLRKTKTFDLLTTQETSLIVGGSAVEGVLEGVLKNVINSFRDRVLGGLGDDTIITGLGNDTVYGGSGNDKIVGGPGSDKLHGGSGDDIIVGGDLY